MVNGVTSQPATSTAKTAAPAGNSADAPKTTQVVINGVTYTIPIADLLAKMPGQSGGSPTPSAGPTNTNTGIAGNSPQDTFQRTGGSPAPSTDLATNTNTNTNADPAGNHAGVNSGTILVVETIGSGTAVANSGVANSGVNLLNKLPGQTTNNTNTNINTDPAGNHAGVNDGTILVAETLGSHNGVANNGVANNGVNLLNKLPGQTTNNTFATNNPGTTNNLGATNTSPSNLGTSNVLNPVLTSNMPNSSNTTPTTLPVVVFDSYSRQGASSQALTNNLPGSSLTPVVAEPEAQPNNNPLSFFPTNDNTVLFSTENLANQPAGLAEQVMLQDGADSSFNAALAALAAQNPDAVMGMIETLPNGTYAVNFFVASPGKDGQNDGSAGQNGQQPNTDAMAEQQPRFTPTHQVQIRVTDNFLPGRLPQDGQGNGVIWAALVNKAYAKLVDMGMSTQNFDPLTTVTGRQVTVLDSNTPSTAAWNALSLANPPLRVPVTAYSGPPETHGDPAITANKAFSVLGTWLDNNDQQMVTLHKQGMLGMNDSNVFSVPLTIYQKVILLTIIADGRPGIDLLSPADPLSGPSLASCCMHARSSGYGYRYSSENLRVLDSPTRLQDQRCLSCAYARNLCLP